MSGPRLSIIPARAATDKALKPRDLQVLCVLGRHTDDLGWCRRSQVKMANEMGCARATVFESINRLIDAGYLERHVQESDSGRDSAHLYRVVLDPKHPDPASVSDADEPCRYVGTPAGISAPHAALEPAPPAGSGPAPINDPSLITPINEEREARASENEERRNDAEAIPAEDNPASAAFRKRVARFCNGTGFVAGPWKDWDVGAALDWIAKRFASLTPEERREAEQWRDAYLLDVAARKKSPQAVGNFLRDRTWTALDPEILKRVETVKAQASRSEERKPDGWASCLGPVGLSRMFAHLLDGPADDELARSSFLPKSQLVKAWPAIARFRDIQQQKGGAVFPAMWHEAVALMEPVPQDTTMLDAWRDEFRRRAWPWPGEFDRLAVVYCPKGGPDALYEFESALRGLGEHDGN
ncbi:helix-turn-helix domain-containing protein [Brucella anthropi]|uniref:helix-turn-helix domain-containing protein n=1 Tax=Brucella anthropi TaxID=529 RepID=UPI002671C3D4|nr:helix-turn-helix domain-containing protein [Brucella anthropi]WKT93753.1 helix-turn-helix domain-containing protein [Brucella anthropi]